MLGIIFTHGRMLAAYVNENEIKWIKINSQPHLNHQENYSAVFFKYFPEILDTALWYAYGNGMTPLESLHLALVFPNDEAISFESERQIIIQWIETAPYRFSTIFVADTMSLLEQSIPKKNVNFLIFEALDEIAHAKTNVEQIESILKEQDFSKLGKKQGIDNIFQTILKELQKKNIDVDVTLKEEIYSNLTSFDVNKKLKINKLSSLSNLSLDINISESRYYDLLTAERKSYKNILFLLNIFANSKLSIIFASDFYNNDVFKGFVSHSLQNFENNGIEILFFSDYFIFETLLNHSYSVITENSQKEATKTKHQLLSEIRIKCTDKRKFRSYYQKYVPIAASLGIPSDVLSQYLKQILFKQKSLSALGEVISPIKQKTTNSTLKTLTLFDYEKSQSKPKPNLIQNTIYKTISDSLSTDDLVESEAMPIEHFDYEVAQFEDSIVNDDLNIFDNITMLFVNEICQLEHTFDSSEFLYFKALLNGQNKPSVIRLLKNNASEYAVSNFKKIYNREKTCFNNLSALYKTENGILYYHRDYIEGEPLEQYVKRTGISKKNHLKDLTSLDLELMIELWQTIYSLKFSYASLNKNSFWITIHWRLPFKKEIEVNLIDIDSTESTLENMENQLLEIFEELFGKNITNEFKQQFKHN